MNELQPIKDYATYNGRMELSIIDKLFFIDKINPDIFVDFGCGDGSLLNHIQSLKGNICGIGYDSNVKMITEIRKNSTAAIRITNDWKFVEQQIPHWAKAALILSSVIHEICHYFSKAEIDDFWKKVFDTGFEYVVIRDMVPSRSIDRPSNVNDVKKIYHKFLDKKVLNDFESIWGSIESNRQLIHFLLKYKYLEPNWDREVRENYLPVSRENLLAKIPKEYDVIFHEHYILPYILQTVKDDTGIEIKDPTHIKLILKRN
jgi:hypothetical protein